MLEFLKKTPQKEVALISKRYRRATDYGKKTVILSCDPPVNGDNTIDNKWTWFAGLTNSPPAKAFCTGAGQQACL
jgi:hypothetical protein